MRQQLEVLETVEYSICLFLYNSATMMHLDLSGMNFHINQLLFLIKNGIKKSKSLLCMHLSGYSFLKSEITELRRALSIEEVHSLHTQDEYEVECKHRVAEIEGREMSKVLGKTQFHQVRALNQVISKSENNQQLQVKFAIKEPQFDLEESDRLVYQRILGKNEMMGSHRWEESMDSKCILCSKYTYCLVMWNVHAS